MPGKPTEPSVAAGRLRDVLLGYLQAAASVIAWPGADGMTLENILDFYPEAVAAGEVPDWQELLRRHPDLSAELQEWLAAKDRWKFAFGRCAEPKGVNPKVTNAGRPQRKT